MFIKSNRTDSEHVLIRSTRYVIKKMSIDGKKTKAISKAHLGTYLYHNLFNNRKVVNVICTSFMKLFELSKDGHVITTYL